MKKIFSLVFVAFFFACSSEKPSGTNIQPPSGEGKGGIGTSASVAAGNPAYALEITPQEAFRNTALSIIAKGFNIAEAKVEWLVNGKEVSTSDPYRLQSVDVRKGDVVRAKAIIQGKEILSNSLTIKNTPPEIVGGGLVKMSPAGYPMTVEVTGRDIDGDEITYSYEWTKNGEPAGKGKVLEVPLKRDDKIEVKVTPCDSEKCGRAIAFSGGIKDMPPVIVENNKYTFDGKVWSCQIKASDPDGDPLTYSLKDAPQGMTINPATGVVTWNVPAEFKGKTSFTVTVSDGRGGEATQPCEVEIK